MLKRIEWLVEDEWANECPLHNPKYWVNKLVGNKKGTGWLNKIFHFLWHFAWVIVAYLICWRIFGSAKLWIAIVSSTIWGIGYEVIWDGLIKKRGISKWDVVFNHLGRYCMASIIYVFGG